MIIDSLVDGTVSDDWYVCDALINWPSEEFDWFDVSKTLFSSLDPRSIPFSWNTIEWITKNEKKSWERKYKNNLENKKNQHTMSQFLAGVCSTCDRNGLLKLTRMKHALYEFGVALLLKIKKILQKSTC